jgi:hypothetical protein
MASFPMATFFAIPVVATITLANDITFTVTDSLG